MRALWKAHGTKLLGTLTSILAIIGGYNSDQLAQLLPATWVPYIPFLIAGLLTILRGFQSSKPAADVVVAQPVHNMTDGQFKSFVEAMKQDNSQRIETLRGQTNAAPKQTGVIDWQMLCTIVALFGIIAILAQLHSCTLFRGSLDQQIGAAKETIAAIESASAQAVTAGSMTADMGQHVYDVSQQAVPILDGAHAAIAAGDSQEAGAQFEVAQGLLQSLQSYVNSHLPKGK